jgi:hypothetical protein
VGVASLVARGARLDTVLWLAGAGLSVLFLAARRVGGLVTVLLLGVFGGAVAVLGSAGLRTVLAHGSGWFLLVAGFAAVTGEVRRSVDPRSATDAATLQRGTMVPALWWFMVFWLATLAALVYGGAVLLGAL